MRVFKNKDFNSWAKKKKLSDKNLKKAVDEIVKGLVDANYGGNLYKKRIPIGSQGKRSGSRAILAYRKKTKIFFLYGFPKNKKSNINDSEEKALKDLGNFYLNLSDHDLSVALKEEKLFEVEYES